MHIAILDDYQNAVRHLACFCKLDGHRVSVFNDSVADVDALAARLADVEALVLIRERTGIDDALLSRLPKLKLISQTGKISNHLSLTACSARGVAVAVIAIVAMTVFYFSPAGQMLRGRTRWFVEDARGGVRLLLWRDSLGMAAARWATGWGPETFPVEFPRYQSEALARAYPDYYQESPHNIFLDAFAAQGMLGLAIALAVPTLGFWACRRAREDRLAAGLAAALIGGLVSGQFMSFILPTA
ncbi:MAG: O-antigen ligase family protein, partial [Betaproteobacteria bacterium]|nr:O-antigen ligase family protein [Betaproteobacteria bacterium]